MMGGKGECGEVQRSVAPQDHGTAVRSTMRVIAGLIVAPFLLLLALSHGHGATLPLLDAFRPWTSPHASSPSTLEWRDIKPSRDMVWHKCYDGELECARLDVPMDWLQPSRELRVTIAVARLRANISHQDPDYRGAVIFNPGGPGGSGIWALRDHGPLLQSVVGPNHDLVTFDPRGVGFSLPRVDCWGGDGMRRSLWEMQEPPVADAHSMALHQVFTDAVATSRRCEAEMSGDDSLLAHVSTASHARDMLEILDQLGQDGLRYWGFSYGTILGGTFAAMYPHRVERLVSDGNVDYREWHLGSHVNFLRDTDKVMHAFFELCHGAGPERCSVFSDTPDAIEARVASIISSVRNSSIIVSPGDGEGDAPEVPFIVDYSRLRRAISSVLYRPIEKFEPFSRVLAALEEGDGWPFWDVFGRDSTSASSMCPAQTMPPTMLPEALTEGTGDAFSAIMCADAEPFTETLSDLEDYAAELQRVSDAAGAVNVLFKVACAGRTIRPKFRFPGPFEANTSFPILYVANVADNVTPLVSARNNSAGFPGSVILIQNSYGHTTLAARSACTESHIRAYFQDGTLPLDGTECEADVAPFDVLASRGRGDS